MMGRTVQFLEDIPCGNIAGLVGVDQYLLKTGTITDYEHAHNMKVMRFSVSPVMRVAVEPNKASDLRKLLEGLTLLAKSDPMVQVSHEESGENVIAGVGELHLEVCLKDLEEIYCNVPIKKSEPIVTYRETVVEKSNVVCLAKSANKLNRIYFTAQPLSEGISEDIENNTIYPTMDVKERSKHLVDRHNWDAADGKKIWCFGPDGNGTNLLVDCTKGVQYLREARENIVAGFQWATKEGVLCGEPMRGVRIDLRDLEVHSDSIHRNTAQISPASQRAAYASVLTANPRLMEPVYLCEITAPAQCVGAVYSLLCRKRGTIVEETMIEGTQTYILKAHLPVSESFGFTPALRSETAGQAFPQCSFSHWNVMMSDPTDAGSLSNKIVEAIRRRKGLAAGLPPLARYLDKL